MYTFDGFEWDERKRAQVFAARSLDIAVDGPAVLSDPRAITAASPQKEETRFKTTGMLEGKIYTVIHTPRDGGCRIITMRRAHPDEAEAYYGEI
jgi:uncharacterized DUF497 family protein